MQERTISITSVAAVLLWTLAVASIAVELLLLVTSADPDPSIFTLGHAGILSGAAAATLNVRGFFCHFAKRENDAFVMGREVGRSEGPADVRRLR